MKNAVGPIVSDSASIARIIGVKARSTHKLMPAHFQKDTHEFKTPIHSFIGQKN